MIERAEEIAVLIENIPSFMGMLFENLKVNLDIKLNNTEEKTLIALLKSKGLPMVDYSKKLGLTKGYFTYVADSLEKKGLIERKTDMCDRRIYQIILTDKGFSIAENINNEYRRHITDKLSALGHDDLVKLKDAIETINAVTYQLKKKRV